MITTVNHNNTSYYFDLSQALPIGIAVKRAQSVASFGIAGAQYVDYEVPGFIGNKHRGGSCNLETITFTPHGNSTHTECIGHIALEKFMVNEHVEDTFYVAKIISASSRIENEVSYVAFEENFFDTLSGISALIIRTLPNSEDKNSKDYSGKNAPSISPEDMQKIVNSGISHLLVDLPSVDPEWDGGKLTAHHIFWNYPTAPRVFASITEFIFVPNTVADGLYMCKLNIAPFESDAAPSSPVVYALTEVTHA